MIASDGYPENNSKLQGAGSTRKGWRQVLGFIGGAIGGIGEIRYGIGGYVGGGGMR